MSFLKNEKNFRGCEKSKWFGCESPAVKSRVPNFSTSKFLEILTFARDPLSHQRRAFVLYNLFSTFARTIAKTGA